MKRSWFFLSLLIFPALIQAGENLALRYTEIETLLRQKNGAVQSSQTSIESANARTGFLARSFLPQVTLSAGGEAFRTAGTLTGSQPFGSADLTINLFRGGRDANEDDPRRAQAEISKAQATHAFLLELTKAQSYYWDYVYFSELIVCHDEILKVNNKGLESAKRRLARGLLSRTDVVGFELHQGLITEQIETFIHEKKLSEISLKAALGLPETIDLTVDNLRIPHDHNDPMLTAELNADRHPELLEIRQNLRIAALQKDKLASTALPVIDLFGTYSLYTWRNRYYADLNDRIDVAGGVRLHTPLFDGFQTSKETDAQTLQVQALSLLASQRKIALSASLRTTQEELRHLDELIHRSIDRLRQTREFLTLVLDDYDRGVKDASDVLNAIETYLNYLKEDASRRQNYQIVRSRLSAFL